MRLFALLALGLFFCSAALAAGGECAKWSLRDITLGMGPAEAAGPLEGAGFRGRGEKEKNGLERRRWTGPGGEVVVVDAEEDVRRILRVLTDPQQKAPEAVEAQRARWGEPAFQKHRLADDRTGTSSEVTVWIDEACDVRATLIARKEAGPRGLQLKYLALALERLSDIVQDAGRLRTDIDKIADF
ncbi:MAG: hypothetical protein KBD01_02425 [Acidobacteria bacterium]|nr:hypothetical protein [Acidobacteriota bacterium]